MQKACGFETHLTLHGSPFVQRSGHVTLVHGMHVRFGQGLPFPNASISTRRSVKPMLHNCVVVRADGSTPCRGTIFQDAGHSPVVRQMIVAHPTSVRFTLTCPSLHSSVGQNAWLRTMRSEVRVLLKTPDDFSELLSERIGDGLQNRSEWFDSITVLHFQGG